MSAGMKGLEERYQPGSGMEGAEFMAVFCDRCTRDQAFRDGTGDSCPIAAATMVFDVEDDEYPAEWVYRNETPTCTAFDRAALAAGEGEP